MTMNAQQVNVQAVLAQLVNEVEDFANDGILKPALEGLVDAYPNGVVAAAMTATFEGVNITPRSAATTSKAKLKARLAAQLDAILDAKTAPTPSGFSLDSYRTTPEKGIAAPASKPSQASIEAEMVAELERQVAALKAPPKPIKAVYVSPMQAKINELQAKLAAMEGRPGTVDAAPVTAQCGQVKRFRGKLGASLRFGTTTTNASGQERFKAAGDGYDISADGVRKWEDRVLVDATLTASQRTAAKTALAAMVAEVNALARTL